jgi:hypothetical protein
MNIAMFSLAPSITKAPLQQHLPTGNEYYSVEFGLNGSRPLYQFKLWHSEQTPHFFLIKDSSTLATRISAGDIIPMKYYCSDPMGSTQHHETRIESVVNETAGRFKGHFRITVNIMQSDPAAAWNPASTDHL